MVRPRHESSVGRRGGLLLFTAWQLMLELIAVASTGIVHRTLFDRLMRISRWRILSLPIPLAFLVGIAGVSHCMSPRDSAAVAYEKNSNGDATDDNLD